MKIKTFYVNEIKSLVMLTKVLLHLSKITSFALFN